MSLQTVSTKLARIAKQSEQNPAMVFTTLAHLMDEDFLTEAFHQLRKDAAAGIDEVTALPQPNRTVVLLGASAGVLYPIFGILLSPVIAAAAMALSSVSVVGNALRLRRIALS